MNAATNNAALEVEYRGQRISRWSKNAYENSFDEILDEPPMQCSQEPCPPISRQHPGQVEGKSLHHGLP
jgi:hypothetical protein